MNSLLAFIRQVYRYIRTMGYFLWMLLPQMFSFRTDNAKLCEIVTQMEEPKFKWVEGRWYHEDPPKVIHSQTGTVFENHPKCCIRILAFSPIFDLLKLTYLVTLFDRKLQVFKNSPKLTIFGTFN